MLYLIDGYNLLHQTPMMTRDRQLGWLQRARDRLILFLKSKISVDEGDRAIIVFDTQRSAPSLGDSLDYGSVQVLFARNHDEADDLLEELIEQCKTPGSLTVVSSDRRVQAAGKRHHARHIVESRSWYEELQSWSDLQNPLAEENLAKGPTEILINDEALKEETRFWLNEFGIAEEKNTAREIERTTSNSDLTQAAHSNPDSNPDLLLGTPKSGSNQPSSKNAGRNSTKAGNKKPKAKTGNSKPTAPKPPKVRTDPEAKKRANRPLPDLDNPFQDEDLEPRSDDDPSR